MASSGGVVLSPEQLEKWCDGVQLYDDGEFTRAVDKFSELPKTSKMLFNIGCCYLVMEEVRTAAHNFDAAISVDFHMAIAYFMNGLISFLDRCYSDSLDYFDKARASLRDNRYIDYTQLGMRYKLYACEIMANQACVLCSQHNDNNSNSNNNNIEKARELLVMANTWKSEARHKQITTSLNMLQAGQYASLSMFTLPKHLIFRPSQRLIDQLAKKDYLGKAKVLVTQNTEEIYACFSGLKMRDRHSSEIHLLGVSHFPSMKVRLICALQSWHWN